MNIEVLLKWFLNAQIAALVGDQNAKVGFKRGLSKSTCKWLRNKKCKVIFLNTILTQSLFYSRVWLNFGIGLN